VHDYRVMSQAPQARKRALITYIRCGSPQLSIAHRVSLRDFYGFMKLPVDLAGDRQDVTGDQGRDRQQHARPGKTLSRSEYRRGIFEQSHRGQQAVHRPVQRVGIAAD
jgi:hypothetical protein